MNGQLVSMMMILALFVIILFVAFSFFILHSHIFKYSPVQIKSVKCYDCQSTMEKNGVGEWKCPKCKHQIGVDK